jgi:hypothetical protein
MKVVNGSFQDRSQTLVRLPDAGWREPLGRHLPSPLADKGAIHRAQTNGSEGGKDSRVKERPVAVIRLLLHSRLGLEPAFGISRHGHLT